MSVKTFNASEVFSQKSFLAVNNLNSNFNTYLLTFIVIPIRITHLS